MWHLILRDLKDLIGDLKYLFITLGVPLIATPLLIFLIVGMSSAKSQQEAERHYRFAINSTQVLPQFYTALKMEKQFNEQVLDKEIEAAQALERELVDAYIHVENNGDKILLTIYHRETNQYSELISKLKAVAENANNALRSEKFDRLGIDKVQQGNLLEPVVVSDKLVKEEKEVVGQYLGMAFNFIIVIWVFTAMMTVAAELITSEKENKTLETLLISPVSRSKVCLSKWLSVTAVGMFSSLATLLMYSLSLAIASAVSDIAFIEKILSLISFFEVLLLWVLLIPLCLSIAAGLTVIGINASTLKEYQGSASFLMILVMIPAMLVLNGVLEWNSSTQWMPVINLIVANIEVIKGTLTFSAVVPLVISNAALIAALMVVANKLFNTEKVLFSN
ncbi:ABC transporter permease [Saccharophagus degradans]|uniref:ABC transporter permease n=1 Tax=Saccharophagus degradans TaxID=86304 RepID=UPI001C091C59|nr:ABC transporter permease [Saccharophagus degradans]MBU2984949.1 ABC transporter permease [Saccharophagus degradans]